MTENTPLSITETDLDEARPPMYASGTVRTILRRGHGCGDGSLRRGVRMTDTNTAPCAREIDGTVCGDPPTWHTYKSTVEQLRTYRVEGFRNLHLNPSWDEGHCIRSDCLCQSYIPPEPPKTAFVVMLDENGTIYGMNGEVVGGSAWGEQIYTKAIPLAEYLPGHIERHEWCEGRGWNLGVNDVRVKCTVCHGSGFVLKEATR